MPSPATKKAYEWVGASWHEGAELNGINEPVRELHEAVKPKLHYAYDRYADAYLRVPA